MLNFIHSGGVSLLGAAPVEVETVNTSLGLAPDLYCADGGIMTAPKTPLAVIGDMDSQDEKNDIYQDVKRVYVDCQETTDFEKCLAAIQAEFYLCSGFLGGRMDHHLASLNALSKNDEKSIYLIDKNEFCFLCPAALCLKLGKDVPFSLYPLTASRAASRGLHWEVTNLELGPDGKIATSNITAHDHVELQMSYGKLLIILPLNKLETVIKQRHNVD